MGGCASSTTLAPPSAVAEATEATSKVLFFDPVKQANVPVPADVAPLFAPFKLGSIQLSHRVVMAPLTRCRAIDRVPTPAMAVYYAQRTTKGGLIISEATIVCESGAGYANTPGMYNDAQEAGWRPIVDAVHAKGGLILCQLWHCGRQSHSEFQPNGALPVAPSAIAIPGPNWNVYTPSGGATPVAYETPRALEVEEIQEMVKTFASAAKRAMACGFDGIEVHGANGYLLDEFLKDSCNQRTDNYGGSIENRCRFVIDITKAVIAEVGDAGRVGIRLSPFMDFGNSIDSTPYGTNVYLCEQLKAFKMMYVHMTEARTKIPFSEEDEDTNVESLVPFRVAFGGTFISAGNFKRANAAEAVRSGHCDLVAFGRPFVSSPDLPARLVANVEPNKWDRMTFYTPDQIIGYTDYPFMSAK